jgi:hypothetical protein
MMFVVPTGAVQPVDGRLGGALVGLQQPGRKMGEVRQRACGTQTLESIDQFVAVLAPAHHHRRYLPVALQGPRHGPFRLRQMQTIAAVVFANLVTTQLSQVVVSPVQHRPNVNAPRGANQYGKLISGLSL